MAALKKIFDTTRRLKSVESNCGQCDQMVEFIVAHFSQKLPKK